MQVFATKDALTADCTVLLCHGAGAVRAGQWARSLCINESLDVGSVLPYIRNCKQRGYAGVCIRLLCVREEGGGCGTDWVMMSCDSWGCVVLNPNYNEVEAPPPQPMLTGVQAQVLQGE